MNRSLLLLSIFLTLIFSNTNAQDFLGINTSNYAGVTGLMLQPASIVDSRHKFDINLFSTSANYSNNYLLVDRKALLKFNSNNFADYQTFKRKYLSEAGLAPGEKAFANISNRTQMPLSFMATLSKKAAIALNIQSRTMAQGRNITSGLAGMAYNGFNYNPLANPVIDASGFNVHALNWAEVGLTYGRVLVSTKQHFVKAAFTGKYLGGIASVYAGSNDISFGINPDSSLNLNTSRAEYTHSPSRKLSDIFNKSFQPDVSSFGFDAGIVYEFRGNIDKLSKISKDDHKAYLADRRDANKYMFRLGVSLLDAGMFNFTKSTFSNNFSANITNWRVADANYGSINDFDTALNNRVTAFPSDQRNYKVHLPTALSVQLDIRFVKGLYLNVMAYRPIKLNNDNGYRFDNYGYYSITPRWEGRHFGLYIPYTFANEIGNYKQNMLGATVRLGSFFIGSSNLGTMAFNKKLSAADIYMGLKISITYGKSTKATRWLEKMKLKKMDDGVVSADSMRTSTKMDTSYSKPVVPASQLLVDYKNGQVFSVPAHPGSVVIINNNYYYGTEGALLSRDTIKKIRYNSDTAIITIDSAAATQSARFELQTKAMQDTLNRKKAQLDTLIKNLEQLRKNMDSSSASRQFFNNDSSLLSFVGADSATLANYLEADRARLKQAPEASDTVKESAIISKSYGGSNGAAPADEAVKKKATQTKTVVAKQNNELPISQSTPAKKQQTQERLYQPPAVAPYYTGAAVGKQVYNQSRNTAGSLLTDKQQLQKGIDPLPTGGAKYLPIPVPVQQSSAVPQGRIDTVYIKETQIIRDTFFVTDTILATSLPVKSDTVVKSVTLKPEKKSIDYNLLPPTIVLFGLNKSNITPVYLRGLNYVAGLLVKDSLCIANISGHTDRTGSARANEIVSLKRANAVKQFLLQKSVNENQLTILTFSGTQPVTAEKGKQADSQNRRVEIKLSNRME